MENITSRVAEINKRPGFIYYYKNLGYYSLTGGALGLITSLALRTDYRVGTFIGVGIAAGYLHKDLRNSFRSNRNQK